MVFRLPAIAADADAMAAHQRRQAALHLGPVLSIGLLEGWGFLAGARLLRFGIVRLEVQRAPFRLAGAAARPQRTGRTGLAREHRLLATAARRNNQRGLSTWAGHLTCFKI